MHLRSFEVHKSESAHPSDRRHYWAKRLRGPFDRQRNPAKAYGRRFSRRTIPTARRGFAGWRPAQLSCNNVIS
jgi:hypothetical protein